VIKNFAHAIWHFSDLGVKVTGGALCRPCWTFKWLPRQASHLGSCLCLYSNCDLLLSQVGIFMYVKLI